MTSLQCRHFVLTVGDKHYKNMTKIFAKNCCDKTENSVFVPFRAQKVPFPLFNVRHHWSRRLAADL